MQNIQVTACFQLERSLLNFIIEKKRGGKNNFLNSKEQPYSIAILVAFLNIFFRFTNRSPFAHHLHFILLYVYGPLTLLYTPHMTVSHILHILFSLPSKFTMSYRFCFTVSQRTSASSSIFVLGSSSSTSFRQSPPVKPSICHSPLSPLEPITFASYGLSHTLQPHFCTNSLCNAVYSIREPPTSRPPSYIFGQLSFLSKNHSRPKHCSEHALYYPKARMRSKILPKRSQVVYEVRRNNTATSIQRLKISTRLPFSSFFGGFKTFILYLTLTTITVL